MDSVRKVLILTLFISFFSFASKTEIKLPDVVFPLEIVAKKKEEKPPLQPPEVLPLTNIKLPTLPKLPLSYPTDLRPILGDLIKPKAFLGIPKEKGWLASIIDDFKDGNFVLAYGEAKDYINTYKNKKNIDKSLLATAYYILGYSGYEIKDLDTSVKSFSKACSFDFYLKPESCISTSIVSLVLGDLNKAKKYLKLSEDSPEKKFIDAVITALQKEEYKKLKDVNCENLDVGLVNYCHYSKAYQELYDGNIDKAISYLKQTQDYDKYKTLMLGYIYLKKGDLKKAKQIFNDFLQKFGRADLLSKYAIYGNLLIALKEGNVQQVLDNIGSLEIRDKDLAQVLYINLALDFFKKKDYVDALALAQRALTLSPKYKDQLKKFIAIAAYNAGYYKYAYNILKTINEPKYYLYTGYVLLKLKNYPEAEYYLKKALKSSKDKNVKTQALKYLADLYFQSDEDKKLIEVLKQLVKYDKKYTANMLGWFFFKKGDYQKAFKAFQDSYMKAVSAFNMGADKVALALANKLNTRKAKFLKAYIYLKHRDFENARKLLKELSNGNDKLAQEAGYLYAYSFFANGEYDKAAKAFEEFYKKYPDTPLGKKAYLRMADSLYNLGEKEKAKQLYIDFMKKYAGTPEAVDAAYLLTLMEVKEKQPNVEQQIETFIKEHPNYPNIDLLKFQLANVYFENGEIEKAKQILRELADKNSPISEKALYRLGYILKNSGNLEEAKKVLMEYLLKYPNGKFSIPVKQLLADIYEKEGNLELAIKLYKQLPATDQNIYKLATLQFKNKDYFEAKKNFETLYEKYPKYKNDIAYYLGKIELENGNLSQAKRYFEDAVKGSDYNQVAESYLTLGDLYAKDKKYEDALNEYINVIYLYSQNKDLVKKARLKAAKILIKEGKKDEAACMIEPIKNTKEAKQLAKESKLPPCIK